MADMWMNVDVTLSEVPVNLMPLIDDTDFKTVEDAVAYNASGMDLRWNFVTTAGVYTSTAVTPTTGGDYDWTHQGDGMYTIGIPASGGASINNDTEGFGWFTGRITGVLPFRGPVIGFRAAALNDALIDGGDNLDVNVTQIEGADPSDTIRDAVVDDATRIDASALNTATGTTIPAILDDTDLIDDATSGLAKIAADVAAILVDTGTTLDGKLNTIDMVVDGIKAVTDALPDAGALTSLATASALATVDSKVDSILADTNELQTDWADGGRLDLILDSRASQSSVDTIDGIVDAILVDTAEIGAAGAGLTAIPWNASWDAEVQSEVDDALKALALDHLVSASVSGSDVADNSIIAKLVSKSATADWDSYDNTTDSLEALRDRGDAAWITATSVTVSDKTGFSLASDGLDAITAWTVDLTGDITGNLSGSVGSVTGNVGGNVTGSVGSIATGGITAASFGAGAITATVIATDAIDADALAADAIAEIKATVDTAISDASLATAAALATVDANVDSVLEDTGTTLPATLATIAGYIDTEIAAIDNVVNAIKVTTDKLDDTLEDDNGTYRFTTNALEQAPSGGEGGTSDWTADEKTAIRAILGIPSSGTTPDDPTAGILNTIRDAVAVVDGNVDSILEDTGTTLPALIDALPTAAENADAVLDEALSGHTTAGTLGKAIADIETDAAAILADTSTDGVVVAPGSKSGYSLAADQSGVTIGTVNALGTQAKADVNAEVDSALSDYDPPTKAELDSGLDALNDLDAAGIRAAVGLATANLDTQLSTINAVVDAILDDTGTSGVVVSTFTTAGKAEIQQEAADALTAYDPPTYAELEARTLAAASYATAANQATIAGYLDTEVAAILAAVDTEVAAIKAKTDNLPASPASTGDIPTASDIATAVFTTPMSESYAAQGEEFTLAQFSYIVHQSLFDSSRAGTTWTIKKLDKSTTAATVTYDDADNPTGASRAT